MVEEFLEPEDAAKAMRELPEDEREYAIHTSDNVIDIRRILIDNEIVAFLYPDNDEPVNPWDPSGGDRA